MIAINTSKSTIDRSDKPNKIHSTADLDLFMSFICDGQPTEMTPTVQSSIELLQYCIPSREAVLTFYGNLFDEYSTYYWLRKKRSLNPRNRDPVKNRVEYVGNLTRRFYETARSKLTHGSSSSHDDQHHSDAFFIPQQQHHSHQPRVRTHSKSSIASPASPTGTQSCSSPVDAPKIIPTDPRIIPVSRRPSSSNSNDIDQTPMSPSAHDSDSSSDEGVQFASPNIISVDIFPELENLISHLRLALFNLASKHKLLFSQVDDKNSSSTNSSTTIINNSNDRLRKRLRETFLGWTTSLLIGLDFKHHETVSQIATHLNKNDSDIPLSNEIDLWLANPVNRLLVDLMLETQTESSSYVRQVINSKQKLDWFLAHALLEISKRPSQYEEFELCIKHIIECNTEFTRRVLVFLVDNSSAAMSKFVNNHVSLIQPFDFLQNLITGHPASNESNNEMIANNTTIKTEENMIQTMPKVKMNLEQISQQLVDKLSAAKVDIISVAHLLKLCCELLERKDPTRICISIKHRLCMSLTTCFFLLLEHESDNFPETLSYIRISLTCMSSLKQSNVASHILCRALLERSLVYGHLFNQNFDPDLIGDERGSFERLSEDFIKLSKENLKVTLGHRFRRLPNHVLGRSRTTKRTHNANQNIDDSDKPDKQSINCYLLIEAFKSSIHNIEAFANLFVEFHCPVMFDKLSWPSDEALRVINERNLSILRKFEQIPPLWDLYELIGQAGCLKSCMVLVKALLAAHLALWSSATINSSADKMISTSRLIPPLAQSGLVPKAFGLAVEVFPHLAPPEVFSVLCDIWQYLKDTNTELIKEDGELSPEEESLRSKPYLNRLRLFMCQHTPNSMYVHLFKNFYALTNNKAINR